MKELQIKEVKLSELSDDTECRIDNDYYYGYTAWELKIESVEDPHMVTWWPIYIADMEPIKQYDI